MAADKVTKGVKYFRPPYTRYREQLNVSRQGNNTFVQQHFDVPPATAHTSVSSGEEVFPGIHQGTNRTMTDWVIPGFKYQSMHGKIFNNPMDSSFESFDPGFGSWSVRASAPTVTGCVRTTTGYPGSALEVGGAGFMASEPIGLESIDIQTLISLAAIETFKRVTPSDVQGLVVAAELTKSISLITKTATTIAAFAKAVKRGDPSRVLNTILGNPRKGSVPNNVPSGAASRWLEYRYGWGPLLMDINGAAQAVARGYEVLLPRRTARGFARRDVTSSIVTSASFSPYNRPNQGSYKLKWTKDQSVNVRGYCLYTADLTYQRLRHFGFTQFASSGWELIPYSFVVDWFIPIGNWLQALEPKAGVTILASGYSYADVARYSRRVHQYVNPPDVDGHNYRELVTLIGHEDKYTRVRKRRRSGLTLPTFPPIDIRMNVKRATDVIALLSRYV